MRGMRRSDNLDNFVRRIRRHEFDTSCVADLISMIHLTQLSPKSCYSCGLCCEGIGSPVLEYATRYTGYVPPRPAGMTPELIEEIEFHFSGLCRGQEPLERCLWFDPVARGCRHYDLRPQICRDYELGGTSCLLSRKKWFEEQSKADTSTKTDASSSL